MPSPFPGMDPYLESPQWTSVHAGLCMEIARQLAQRLPDRYVARTNERFVLAAPEPDDDVSVSAVGVYPDAYVADAGTARHPPAVPSGGVTVVAPPLLDLPTVMPESIRQLTVEVRDAQDAERLVTAIEVLSPTNKRGEGRDEYLAKRRRLLLSTAHLMEIDLLRGGQRVPMRRPLPSYPFFVLLSRAERRPNTAVWPVRIDEPLPVVPVPLLPGDADVPVDLQDALRSVYETFRYDRTVDYTRPPAVPLAEADAAWVRDHLGIPRQPPGP